MPPQQNQFLFTQKDLALSQLTHTFAEASVWLEDGLSDNLATYDVVVRDMPVRRNYLVMGGLAEALAWLQNIHYRPDQIRYLLRSRLITKKLASYLKRFKFHGEVSALPDGTIFFPGEPIIRIIAPIIEASLIEVFLFNAISSNVMFMTKAVRMKQVLGSTKGVSISLGMQRAHSFESGFKAMYNGHISGIQKTVAIPSFEKKQGHRKSNYVINAQHLFIKSYPKEIDAFRALAKHFPDNCSFMVDTYDVKQGITNAIIVAKELKVKGYKLKSITIDGGNLIKLVRYARKELDKHSLKYVEIIVASNLDEYKIKKMVNSNVPANIYVVATEYNTLADSPKIEVVYKLAELRQGKKIRQVAKLTPGKESYPGRKNVFRKFKDGKMINDTIGLDKEKLGQPLLVKYMEKGILKRRVPEPATIQGYIEKQLDQLPNRLKHLKIQHTYPVTISSALQKSFNTIKKDHQG
ncbi:MAG: nicotinate phosphoribosyltransferase [Patescibacteria group bacterium]